MTVLSYDFVAGLITGERSFMWIQQNNGEILVFQLKMRVQDKDLVAAARDTLNLHPKVHENVSREAFCFLEKHLKYKCFM